MQMYVRGRDLLHYIDHEGCQQGLISGYPKSGDIAHITCTVHILAAKLECRVFYEHVHSDANCIDGMSRHGLHDPYALRSGWQCFQAEVPELSDLGGAHLELLTKLFHKPA